MNNAVTTNNTNTSLPPIAKLARGSYGDLVHILQRALAQSGHYTGGIDSDFGGGTQTAVRRFQLDRQSPDTGFVTADDWVTITGTDWPDLFERCLQVTARFEGQGYTTIVGNFDGAGLTWGIIGFTLNNGEIQRLLRDIDLRDPDLLEASFGSLLPELRAQLALPAGSAAQLRWANSISMGNTRYLVRQDWRNAFSRLGDSPLAKVTQREAAWKRYFVPAEQTAARLGLNSDLGVLLAFDTHVQNGSVKATIARDYLAASQGWPATQQRRRREDLARRIAASARLQYRGDVLARKNTIAVAEGVVHGSRFDLSAWGLSID